MDGQLFSDSITPAIPSIKPTVRRYSAARFSRELSDIALLKTRVKDVTTLGDDLIDLGSGYRWTVNEGKAALLNPQFRFTVRERTEIQADIDASLVCELSCRAELANIAPWTQMAHRSSWKEMADAATLRDLANAPQGPATGRLRNA